MKVKETVKKYLKLINQKYFEEKRGEGIMRFPDISLSISNEENEVNDRMAKLIEENDGELPVSGKGGENIQDF